MPAGRNRFALARGVLLPVEGGDDSLERRLGRHVLVDDAGADVSAQR
jgi:hypothetical protein